MIRTSLSPHASHLFPRMVFSQETPELVAAATTGSNSSMAGGARFLPCSAAAAAIRAPNLEAVRRIFATLATCRLTEPCPSDGLCLDIDSIDLLTFARLAIDKQSAH